MAGAIDRALPSQEPCSLLTRDIVAMRERVAVHRSLGGSSPIHAPRYRRARIPRIETHLHPTATLSILIFFTVTCAQFPVSPFIASRRRRRRQREKFIRAPTHSRGHATHTRTHIRTRVYTHTTFYNLPSPTLPVDVICSLPDKFLKKFFSVSYTHLSIQARV